MLYYVNDMHLEITCCIHAASAAHPLHPSPLQPWILISIHTDSKILFLVYGWNCLKLETEKDSQYHRKALLCSLMALLWIVIHTWISSTYTQLLESQLRKKLLTHYGLHVILGMTLMMLCYLKRSLVLLEGLHICSYLIPLAVQPTRHTIKLVLCCTTLSLETLF